MRKFPARNRLTHLLSLVILTLGLSGVAASTSQALTINTATSGLHVGYGCTTASFCPFTKVYELDLPGEPVSGTFDLAAGILTFSITLTSGTFSATGGGDGGVTSVDFDVTYSGSVAVGSTGPDMYGFTDELTSVVGTVTPTGAGAVSPINLVGTVNTSGNCNDPAGPSLTCGITFGAGTLVMPVTINGQARYFQHIVDIHSIVPEPNTAMLLGLGLIALGRKRSRAGQLPIS